MVEPQTRYLRFGDFTLDFARSILLREGQELSLRRQSYERALELNNSYGSAYAELGRTKIELGRADEGIGDIKRAIAFSPTDPALHTWCFWAGQAAIHVGDYANALDWLRKAQDVDPFYENPTLWLAVALGEVGQIDKARAIVADFLEKNIDYNIAAWNEDPRRQNPVVAAQRARIESMLCRLGIPGCPLTTGSAQ